MKPYTVMLVITEKTVLSEWVKFATRLLPSDGELHLRGLVTVDLDKSLSEGALLAREWRDVFSQVARSSTIMEDNIEVFVDYRPFQRVLHNVRENDIDLLIVEWGALEESIGGLNVEDILRSASCDIVLVSGIQNIITSHSVLLALRGGPNLTIGIQVASSLALQEQITLFHAVDQSKSAPDLEAVMRTAPQITRTVTAVTEIVNGIVHESREHDIIVMGSGLRQRQGNIVGHRSIFRQVYERTRKSIVLVQARKQEPLDFHTPHFHVKEDDHKSVQVDRWFAENTFHSSEFDDLNNLMALKEKQGVTISVALPALNEEATIEKVIKTIKKSLMDNIPLLDEIVLIDSNSSDKTVEIAKNCGIPTYIHQQLLTNEVGTYSGKGEALWKSLYVTKGDIIAWIDTDITNIHPRFIYGLLGPLLKQSRIQYVKGFYARPIKVGSKLQAFGGGRVTELVARPMLNLFYPELSGIVQPLSGEYAGRRTALEQMPFFSGYGVETGLLIDLLNQFGLEAIGQTDLEMRIHHNQSLVNLSKMSFAILQVFMTRLEGRLGVNALVNSDRSMKLIIQEPERFALEVVEIGDYERPPMITVTPYNNRFE